MRFSLCPVHASECPSADGMTDQGYATSKYKELLIIIIIERRNTYRGQTVLNSNLLYAILRYSSAN